jgi:rRNA maturation protein Nop10
VSRPARAKLPCPGCGAPAAITVGPRYAGRRGLLWWRRSIDEQLFRCAEGHVYSVRTECGRAGEDVTSEVHENVEDWLRLRTGAEPPRRPPGL